MNGIYIASTTARAGKSLLTITMGLLLQKMGYSVGYMKPLGRIPQKKEDLLGDADALVVQELLGQSAAADEVTPLIAPENMHVLALWKRGGEAELLKRMCSAYSALSHCKDITLVSGSGAFPSAGRFAGADGLTLLKALDLKVLFVERYSYGINYDQLLLLKDILGPAMLGVVINNVPKEMLRDTSGLLAPWLSEQGIAVHGVIPNEPELSAMRIVDLAHGLNGRVVAGNARSTTMVQSFVIGTMQVDNFMMHLRQRSGSAVIVGGDRSDLQLVALHAGSPCIILTGNLVPSELIRARAEEKGVTLIVVREDTYTVARIMARILKSKKLRDLHQIKVGVHLVENSLSMDGLVEALGLQRGYNSGIAG